MTISDGIFDGKIQSAKVTADEGIDDTRGLKGFITGGSFSTSLADTNYLSDNLNAELKKSSGEAPYSYYETVKDAVEAAESTEDVVTNLNPEEGSNGTVTFHTVTYNGEGVSIDPVNVEDGETITLPTPSNRSNYTFNGWYNGTIRVGGAGDSYQVNGSVTLTAQWTYTGGSYVPPPTTTDPGDGDEGEDPSTDPEDPDDGETDIPDADVPLGDVPQTGDISYIWGFSALISGAGLAVLVLTNKKREEDAE